MLSDVNREALEFIFILWLGSVLVLVTTGLGVMGAHYVDSYTKANYEEDLESRVEYLEQFLPEATLQETNGSETNKTTSPSPTEISGGE